MSRKEILYFESPGEANTDETLKIAKERADKLGVKDVVIASTGGGTGVKTVELFKGYNLVVVPHITGLREPGQQELTEENMKKNFSSFSKMSVFKGFLLGWWDFMRSVSLIRG